MEFYPSISTYYNTSQRRGIIVRLHMRFAIALAASLLIAVSAAAGTPAVEQWRIAKVEHVAKESALGQYEEVTVHFTNGHAYAIPLYRATPIAVLTGIDGTPFLLVSGADCTECDENNSLRFFVLGGEKLIGSGKRYTYPGALTDYMSPQLMEKTRTFYGRCLSKQSDVVLWFQEYLGEDGKWHKINSVARVTKDGDTLVELTGSEASLSSVEARTKADTCTELPGIDGTTEP